MRFIAAAFSGVVAFLCSGSAFASECLVNGNPVAPHLLAYELESATGGIASQIATQPISVVSLTQAAVTWDNCSGSCPIVTYQGESQCGNLVENPVDFYSVAELVEGGSPDYAFSEVSATHATTGKWETFSVALLKPEVPANYTANYIYELGTREVIDVTSTATGVQPLKIRLLAGGQFGLQQCFGALYHALPSYEMRFRVTEFDENFIERKLVPTQHRDNFFATDEIFNIELKPNVRLIVDVHLRVGASVHTQNQDGLFNECWGATTTFDFAEGPEDDGIQLFFSPAESLTLAPRSGIVYETAPEVESSAAAIAMLLGLAARRARSRTS